MKKKTVSVFCGSSPGDSPIYKAEMRKLGQLLAREDWRIVYGGIRGGVMQSLALGALEDGGRVKAFVPQCASYKGRRFESGVNLIRVHDKYERMSSMARSHAFIVGPGSFGTLSDAMNILERNYRAHCMGQPLKPLFFINMNGLFDTLEKMNENFIKNGFAREGSDCLVRCVESAEQAVEALKAEEEAGVIAEIQNHVIRASGQLEHL